MTAAVIALSLALAAALGVTSYLAYRLVAGLRSERASFAAEVLSGKAQVAAELAQRAAERERDEALASWAKAANERDAAYEQLTKTQQALASALEEHAHETVEAIRSAPTAVDALDRLERLLQATARSEAVPADSATASDDRGDA